MMQQDTYAVRITGKQASAVELPCVLLVQVLQRSLQQAPSVAAAAIVPL